MRLRTELCLGLALVVAALALGGVPASAIETQPGAPVALASLVTPAAGERGATAGASIAMRDTPRAVGGIAGVSRFTPVSVKGSFGLRLLHCHPVLAARFSF